MSSQRNLKDVTADIEALIADAYQRGVDDGSRTTLDRLMKAATSMVSLGSHTMQIQTPPVEPSAVARPASPTPSTEKAPVGTIRPLVELVLDDAPGITTAEVGRKVHDLDPRVTPASVVNELNRNTARGVGKRGHGDVLYVKLDRGWHLARNLQRSEPSEGASATEGLDQNEKGPTAQTVRPYMNGGTSEAPVTRLRAD